MLILNPERLRATREPLLPKPRDIPRYAIVVRLVLAGLTTLAAMLIGYSVTQYLSDAWQAWAVFAAIGAFVYLATLTVTVVTGARWQLPLAVVWGACLALMLPWRSGTEMFAIAGIVALSGAGAYYAYASAVKSYATLHTFAVVREYASVLATGVVIALIVLYGAAVSRGSALLPQGALSVAADRAAQFIPAFVPALSSSSSSTVSVRELAMASAKAQLEDDPRYRALSVEEQAEVLRVAADQAAATFSKQLGVPTSADDSIGTAAQSIVGGVLERFQDKYGWYFTLAWLLGAFFIARSAAVIMTLVIAVLSWLTVTAALSLGLLRVEVQPSVHEQITL